MLHNKNCVRIYNNVAKSKLCNIITSLFKNESINTNVFLKCSVLIFGRRQTVRRKLYCWGIGIARISFNG